MNKFERKLKDIPELIERLRDERARQKDYISSQALLSMKPEPLNEKSATVLLSIERKEGNLALEIQDQAHQQIAMKTLIPKLYYDRMRIDGMQGAELLSSNVNHWLGREALKKRLLRTVDGQVRAFLSGRYRPIAHLDLVTTVAQTVSGMAKVEGQNWAEGARCVEWALSPMKLDVLFVNPRIGVNLDQLSEGFRVFTPEELGIDGFFRGRQEPGTHWVFPSLRERNSETGHGGMSAASGLFEGMCLNGSVRSAQVTQVHLGKELSDEDVWSPDTLRKMNAVIFAKVRDLTASMFEPKGFVEVCKRFKGLENVEVDVKEAVASIVELAGLNEDIRDEIFEAYLTTTKHRGNLFDVQRATTATAHAFRESSPEIASALEEMGGKMIDEGAKALVGV